VFTNENGAEVRHVLQKFEGQGIIQSIHNLDTSIRSFAEACFAYALDQRIDLWFATKDTISKMYDHRFKEIFEEIYQANYKESFKKRRISYFYTLIDDAIARIINSEEECF